MSVQPGPTFKRIAANGVATAFTIPFLLLDAADLQITLNGTLVTTGFTLTGIGNPQSTCTFTAAPTGDLLFQQVMTFQRLTDYQTNGDFQSSTVNRDYDRLWLAVKQLNRDSSRALTVSLLEPEGIPPLPVKAVRALKMMAFDSDGNPIVSNLTLAQIEQQPALALESAAQASASAGEAAGYRDAAGVQAGNAANSAILAGKWAENPEDVPVTPGFFSAHHWANKAAAAFASVFNRPGGLIVETIYSTVGTFTWTKNAATKRIEVEVWGGGSGGGHPAIGATAGGSSSFDTSSAGGGSPTSASGTGGGGIGSVASGGTLNLTGANGIGIDSSAYGGPGGSAPRGGRGGAYAASAGPTALQIAGQQPGGGGGGVGNNGSGTGSSGAYCYLNKSASIPATASVVVGAAGVGGTGMGNGGAGMVIVREYA